MNKRNPFVISISGVSGSGKTTVAKHLNQRLKNTKMLSFDDYDFDGPDNIIDWVDRGADYDEWNLKPLIKDLEKLLAKAIEYVILDYPFAYKHSQMRDLIDLALYVDTPLDIALARRITRDFSEATNKEILRGMNIYLSRGRRGYLEMINSVKPSSDIIVDGTMSVENIINYLEDLIIKERKKVN